MKTDLLPFRGFKFADGVRLKSGVLLGILWLMTAGDLPAGQFVPLSIEDMTAHADLVVWGKVQGKQSQQDAAGRLFTRIDLEVFETWKGSVAGKHMTLVHGGGVVGNKAARVSGQAVYAPGDEVVVFLVMNSRGEGVTLGLAQGKFEVWPDRASGVKLTGNLFHGRSSGDRSGISPSASASGGGLTLEALRKKVRGEQQ